MNRVVGDLKIDKNGEIYLKMQISPQSPDIIDVPLKELLEECMNQRIAIEINPSEKRM